MSNEKENVVTPTGRVCFLKNLYSPDEKGKYKATLLFDKVQDLSKIKKIMMEAAKTKFKAEEVKSKKFKWGIKAPDEDGIENFDFFTEDTIILNAATKFEVEVKSAQKGPDSKYEDLIEGDLKAGDYCRFLISAYPWEFEGKKGVSLNLMAVQMIKEGEAFYSRRPSDSFFSEEELDVEAEAAVATTTDTSEDAEASFDW